MATPAEFEPDHRLPQNLTDLLITNYSVPPACLSKPPTSVQLFHALDTLELSIFGILTFLTVLSFIIFVENAAYLSKKIRCSIKQTTLIWSSATPTVVSVFCCFGLWFPRSMMFVDMFVATYFSFHFYLILMVMIQGFGGKEALVKTLQNKAMVISTGPCCCCCPCLPRMKMTMRKLNIFILGVCQLVFLKPVFTFIGIMLWSDGSFDVEDTSLTSSSLWIGVFLGVSMTFALWPIGILYQEARVHLAEQNIKTKFSAFQILLILTALQHSIFSILAGNSQIACDGLHSSKARSQLMHNQLLIVETFLLAIVVRTRYRKRDEKAGYGGLPVVTLDEDADGIKV
ncbi:organic solute transporter subunit alpha-like [Microcaecilia unicolor]|uniref:Organic solute transporter subunit alpha-like n=1 Tax=Microcaecilia unicolor TaxID=1415580 RepID=A0A6P7Z8M0_9AMPH|nr:organic solute transporter subunit alpha-like [Microcaecilia unicolor]